MEKIEQVLDLPKMSAAVVARDTDNLSFLDILLSEEEAIDEKLGYDWYLNLKYLAPNKKFSPASIELEPEEVQFLQDTLKKALFKLIILEKIKIEGSYTLTYEGIKNLRFELKSQDNNARLELTFCSNNRKKFVTKLLADDIRAILLKLQTVKTIGETLVKQLETIEALTQNLVSQSVISQPAAVANALVTAQPGIPSRAAVTSQPSTTSQPIDGENLVRQLEKMVKKTKRAS